MTDEEKIKDYPELRKTVYVLHEKLQRMWNLMQICEVIGKDSIPLDVFKSELQNGSSYDLKN